MQRTVLTQFLIVICKTTLPVVLSKSENLTRNHFLIQTNLFKRNP